MVLVRFPGKESVIFPLRERFWTSQVFVCLWQESRDSGGFGDDALVPARWH